MNILFCGDHNAEKGVLIATLSLLKNTHAELHLYILTMNLKNYQPFTKHASNYLRNLIQKKNPNNTLLLIDCTTLFIQQPPTINMGTRFTPYAMLRLFADQLPQIPDRILYLDVDVIVRRDLQNFYSQDLTKIELVGVLDYWGRFFFHNIHEHRLFDYLNSGVLLLNMSEIKKNKLFIRIRQMIRFKKMFFPDQSALNKLAKEKKIAPRRYNEQYRLQKDTVIQHFTTSFRFLPYFHIQTIKPWEISRIHQVLNLYEYDDILNEYIKLKNNL